MEALVQDRRKEAAKKAVATKYRKTMELMDREILAEEIAVPVMTDEKLIRAACHHYNMRQQQRRKQGKRTGFPVRPKTIDFWFGSRLAVNYLRHMTTPYDGYLAKVKGKVGKRRAYWLIRQKVLTAIAKTYPWLAGTCQMQLYGPRDEED